TDIIDIAEHVTTGKLNELDVSFKERASVCKYLVPEGYPEDPVTDTEIRITEPLGDALLFYSSVYEKDGKVYTTSSRAIALVGIAENIIEAEAIVEEAMHAIKGSLHARHDIGTEQLLQQRIDHMNQVRGR
ncbi:phosphoribosylamine--glycine ligase, partial [Methanosarcinales archaeon ex4484_138]